MNDIRTNKRLLWLSILSAMLILLLSIAFSWLDDSDYEKLLKIIHYKWQLIIWMMIITFGLFAYLYSETFRSKNKELNKQEDEDIPNTNVLLNEADLKKKREKILRNLADEERSILFSFLYAGKKSILIEINGTVLGLEEKGILNRPIDSNMKIGQAEFTIDDWSWKFLNKNKEVLAIKSHI